MSAEYIAPSHAVLQSESLMVTSGWLRVAAGGDRGHDEEIRRSHFALRGRNGIGHNVHAREVAGHVPDIRTACLCGVGNERYRSTVPGQSVRDRTAERYASGDDHRDKPRRFIFLLWHHLSPWLASTVRCVE